MFIDKDTTNEISSLSVYPIFVVEGGQYIAIQKGSEFVDPGVKVSEVKEGDNDLSNKLEVKGSVDSNIPGLYFITYVATNTYNYKDSIKRAVLVYDGDLGLNADLTGKYKLGPARMEISKNSVQGYWNVTNVYMKGKEIPVVIGDIGNDSYVIIPGSYSIPDETGKYEGNAEYDSSREKIRFNYDLILPDGTIKPKSKNWSKY